MQKIYYIFFVSLVLFLSTSLHLVLGQYPNSPNAGFGISSSLQSAYKNGQIPLQNSSRVTPIMRKVWFGMSIDEVKESEGRQPLLARVLQNDVNQQSITYQEDVYGMTLLLYYLFIDNRLSNIMYYCIANCSKDNFINVALRMQNKYGAPNLVRDEEKLQYTWRQNRNQESYLIVTAYQNQNTINVEEQGSFTIGYVQEGITNQILLPN